MKINPAPFHLAQAIITGLVVVFSIAILGTSAHTLDVFNKQQSTNPWWMPLWPQHFDTHGTKALVASSVVTVVLCGAFLVAFFLPKVSILESIYTFENTILIISSLPFARNTHSAPSFPSLLFYLPSSFPWSRWSGHTSLTAMLPISIPSKHGRASIRAVSRLHRTSLCPRVWVTQTLGACARRASLPCMER